MALASSAFSLEVPAAQPHYKQASPQGVNRCNTWTATTTDLKPARLQMHYFCLHLNKKYRRKINFTSSYSNVCELQSTGTINRNCRSGQWHLSTPSPALFPGLFRTRLPPSRPQSQPHTPPFSFHCHSPALRSSRLKKGGEEKKNSIHKPPPLPWWRDWHHLWFCFGERSPGVMFQDSNTYSYRTLMTDACNTNTLSKLELNLPHNSTTKLFYKVICITNFTFKRLAVPFTSPLMAEWN